MSGLPWGKFYWGDHQGEAKAGSRPDRALAHVGAASAEVVAMKPESGATGLHGRDLLDGGTCHA